MLHPNKVETMNCHKRKKLTNLPSRDDIPKISK